MVTQGAIGSSLLVLPLLGSILQEEDFWSLGPLGEAWWVALIVSLVGLATLGGALANLGRMLLRAARAREGGYGWGTVALVAADSRRDSGFVLQGGRAYSTLALPVRRRLLLSRVAAPVLYLLGAVWLPLAFAASVMLAARGIVNPSGAAALTLGPTLLFVVLALILRAADASWIRKARHAWFRQPWSADLAQAEVAAWNEQVAARRAELALTSGTPGSGRPFRWAAVALVPLGMIMLVPAVTLLLVSALAPAVARIAAPRVSFSQEKTARVEMLRRYRLESDPSVSPDAAGQALHTVAYVGVTGNLRPEMVPPLRRYAEPWLPDRDGGPIGIEPFLWSRDLVARAIRGGLGVNERAYLAGIAAHPAHQELSLLARAANADIVSTRWPIPLPDTVSLIELPLPTGWGIRQGAYAHVGKAVLQAADGHLADAERTMREVISVGFLLGDHSPFILDNLVGYGVVDIGGEALQALYQASGRGEAAGALAWAAGTVERTVEIAQVGLRGSLAEMPAVVLDERAMRGLRWELFGLVNTLGPCINLRRAVFGPDEGYQRWLETVHDSLVRSAAEEELFQLASRGLSATKARQARARWIGWLVDLTLGGRSEPGSCAALVDQIRTAL
ncbi:MAG: hypothetical protein HY704_09740 [Gemmatimonadetes bacterium]|nr:hypothetical protein [Gemmatimonadota bacterium]